MTDWHVGMQVVCVDDSVGALNKSGGLVKGCVYTIGQIEAFASSVYVQVREFPMLPGDFMRASRFRPVRKTSIDCFLKLLERTEREVATTTSTPVVALLPDLIEQGSCHYPDALERRLSAGISLRPTRTRALPAKVDGRASDLLHPFSPSEMASSLSSVESKETPTCRRMSPRPRSIAPQIRSIV